MALHIAVVKPEREFVHIAVQVLFAGMVIDAVQAALQHRPDAFDAIGRYAIPDIFARAVVVSLVLIEHRTDAEIAAVFIGVDGRSRFHIGVDFRL